jgi:rhodanese-related sulfurtransferase
MSKTVIDVRTTAEYMGGHAPGSINIPLQQLPEHIQELKTLPQPIILCCASGIRSMQATALLKSQGINCENGGSWINFSRN